MYLLEFHIHQFHDDLVKRWPFWWMVWNGGLALIPALMSLFFFRRKDQPRHGIRGLTFGFEMALVLLILPNAPYITTDLVHFLETVRMGDTSLWKLLGTELPIYMIFVLFGLTCYSFTVDRLLYALRMRLGKGWGWLGIFGIPLLSSLGIYLGRVARYNSWDVLTDPQGIIQSSWSSLDKMKIAKVLIGMWIGLILIHQIYRTLHDGIVARLAEYRRDRNATGTRHSSAS
jgi:uncharacterized membrane protein